MGTTNKHLYERFMKIRDVLVTMSSETTIDLVYNYLSSSELEDFVEYVERELDLAEDEDDEDDDDYVIHEEDFSWYEDD